MKSSLKWCHSFLISSFIYFFQGARGLPGERGRPGPPGPSVSVTSNHYCLCGVETKKTLFLKSVFILNHQQSITSSPLMCIQTSNIPFSLYNETQLLLIHHEQPFINLKMRTHHKSKIIKTNWILYATRSATRIKCSQVYSSCWSKNRWLVQKAKSSGRVQDHHSVSLLVHKDGRL